MANPATIWIDDVPMDDCPRWRRRPVVGTPARPYQLVPYGDDSRTGNEVWLAPGCEGADDDREWCHDNVFEPCQDCGAKPATYRLIGLYHQAEKWR